MTLLRDARFQKALAEAPDADARPAPAVAQTIRAAARNALAPAAKPVPRPWWQRLWHSTGQPRAPWGAAFATMLLAVLVTVLWVREPIPDARPPVPMPAPAPANGPATKTLPANTRAGQAVPTKPAPARREPAPQAMADAAETTMRQPAWPVPAPPVQELAGNEAVAAKGEEAQTHAALPAVTAPTAAAPLASARRAQPNQAASGLESWTRLQVQVDGRSSTLDRAQGQSLFAHLQALAQRLVQVPGDAFAVPAGEPALRLTVLSQDQMLAVLHLWDGVALWQRQGQVDQQAELEPAELQALLLLARQALAASAAAPP